MWNWDGGWWLGMGAGMLLWIVLVVLAVWLVVRGLMAVERRSSGTAGTAGSPDPERILRERFARGEIDEDEYRKRLAVIRGA